jgi:hypothetical protein
MGLPVRQSELVDTLRAIQTEELPYVLVGGWAVSAYQTRRNSFVAIRRRFAYGDERRLVVGT